MPGNTDHMLARYVAEIEEKQQLIDSIVEAAENEKEPRDLSQHEMELVTRARDRIRDVNDLMQPLEESRRISGDSAKRIAELAKFMSKKDDQPRDVEYR